MELEPKSIMYILLILFICILSLVGINCQNEDYHDRKGTAPLRRFDPRPPHLPIKSNGPRNPLPVIKSMRRDVYGWPKGK